MGLAGLVLLPGWQHLCGIVLMSVTVRWIDGDPVTYAAATSANLDSGFMRLSIWNRKKRRLEDVAVLDARRITLAEVIQNGVVKQRVLGLGQRPLK